MIERLGCRRAGWLLADLGRGGFLFWGALDVGKARVLTPNAAVPACVPGFFTTPPGLRQGQVLAHLYPTS